MAHNWKLSPSDFAFLWRQCPRCFYLKIKGGLSRPFSLMPGIFSIIAGQMHNHFLDRRTEDVAPDLPPGVFAFGEKTVHSAPIALPGHSDTCYIRGRLDAVVRFDDGSYAVIDFKTTAVKPGLNQTYSRQLRAYAYALEHPAPGKLSVDGPIEKLGLIAYEPQTFTMPDASSATLSGNVTWVEIRRNPDSFMAFLDEVLTVLEGPEPPEADPGCAFCKYRAKSRTTGL